MKETMVMFGLRIPPKAIDDLRRVALRRHLPTRTMIRMWIMEKLDQEKKALEIPISEGD